MWRKKTPKIADERLMFYLSSRNSRSLERKFWYAFISGGSRNFRTVERSRILGDCFDAPSHHHRKPWVWVRKFSLQPMAQRCYIRLFTLKICMNHINQSNFIRAKFTRRNRKWRATRTHNKQFYWVGRGHRGHHAYLIENKRASQGGPTVDERENRWESLMGYRRCLHTYPKCFYSEIE